MPLHTLRLVAIFVTKPVCTVVYWACSVDVMLNMLLLKRASDTFIGNDMIRGVSGGEKKRVTTGEMLVSV